MRGDTSPRTRQARCVKLPEGVRVRRTDGRSDRYLRELEQDIADRRAQVIAAHEAHGPFISALSSWDCFLTAEYDPSRRLGAHETVLGVVVHPRVSRWKALRDAERLWEFACRLTGTDVPAVISVEPHMDCSYHLHGVMNLSGGRRAYLEALKWWWSEHYGFCHFDAPRGSGQVSTYVGKHLSGPLADVWFSPGLNHERG